jgi:flagellar biosynthesis regulator FlaF
MLPGTTSYAFFPDVREEERLHSGFQQDIATAPAARASLKALREVFDDYVFNHSLWPSRFPDLTPSEIYLCGNLKDKMYKINPHILEEPRNNIRCEISAVSGEEL